MKEKKLIAYEVKVTIGYYATGFRFDSIEDAGSFMELAVIHNVQSEDRAKFELIPVCEIAEEVEEEE